MSTDIPTIELGRWLHGSAAQRAAVAAEVDEGLQRVGFLLVTGHEVPAGLRAAVRESCREFFALPAAVKEHYTATIGERGWLPPGVEANGYAEGAETPPDLKESFAVGADTPTGDPAVDAVWFPANVWPAEVPTLGPVLRDYLAAMRSLADELLRLCAAALGLGDDHFTRFTGHPTHTLNINHYPPLTVIGPAEPGQYRIGPHTDFGTVTLLDREAGVGGLQVDTDGRGFVDAPFVPGAYTVNVGDLLARWTGDRWRSGRHRVLPPSPTAPDEDLISLVYFYETDHDALVEALGPPIGRTAYPPVVASAFIKERLDAITV